MSTKFIFSLDSLLPSANIQSLIAQHFDFEGEISELCKDTELGNVPYVESVIRKVFVLGKLPVNEVSTFLEGTEVQSKVLLFIQQHKKDCVLTTGSLSCWVDRLVSKIGCECHSSEAEVKSNSVSKIISVLRKEEVVEKYQEAGYKVVFVGCDNDDLEAMRTSDIAIATGIMRYPSKSTFSFTDYMVFSEEALCRQLNQLL